jgi:hypothetical protein
LMASHHVAHVTENKIKEFPESLARLSNLHILDIRSMFDHSTHSAERLLIVADNPLDSYQAIPVLLAVLLNNPNLKPGKTPSGISTGIWHSILNGSVLDEFAVVDRSNRARAIKWLTQRRRQVCDDAVHIAQQQSQATGSTH